MVSHGNYPKCYTVHTGTRFIFNPQIVISLSVFPLDVSLNQNYIEKRIFETHIAFIASESILNIELKPLYYNACVVSVKLFVPYIHGRVC